MSKIPEDDSPHKEDIEQLIETLKNDSDWNKRFGAASKLFRSAGERAIDPLINTLQNDAHKEMRRFAADLLGRLGDQRATWALIASLRLGLVEKDTTMIFHSTEALLKIKGSDLPSILISTIEDKEEFYEMRIKALEMLGSLGDSKSVQGLINIIRNPETDGKIRGRAIDELVKTGNLAGLQLILELLDISTHKDFQKVVVRALGETPFKNKTIVFRIGDSLLKIMENEEKKKDDKDTELTNLTATAIRKLASNIGFEFNQFLDELIDIRKKLPKK
ncbi:MAG: HEAT repeat domain-containing protein [Asgard group archaeon]|nr:HEAT repeat domain-containing protein [Asgard group archaeon]